MKLLRDGAKGDPFKLFDLANSINRDNYSLDVLDAVLPHVEYAKLPRTITASNPAGGERVFGVFACISASLQFGCPRTPSLQEATITRLMASFDDVLAWMSFALARLSVSNEAQFVREALWTMASILYQLCMLNSESSNLVLASREAAKLFLKAWSLRSKSSGNVYSTLGFGEGDCMLIRLLHIYLFDKEGLATFLEVVLASPKNLKLFCNALMSRINQLPAQIGAGIDAMDFGMECMLLLATIHLAFRWVKSREIVRQLRLSNCHSRSVTMFAHLQQRFPPNTILRIFPTLISLISDPRAAEEMLDGGIVGDPHYEYADQGG